MTRPARPGHQRGSRVQGERRDEGRPHQQRVHHDTEGHQERQLQQEQQRDDRERREGGGQHQFRRTFARPDADLLDLLDIDGAVVTLDAMHTQTEVLCETCIER